MRHTYFICSLLIASMRLLGQADSFYITGEIDKKFDNQFIMLFTFKDDTIFTVDTATVKGGTFHFSGKEYPDDFSLISTGNYPDTVKSFEVILEKGKINVKDYGKFYRVSGTNLNDLFQSHEDSVRIYTTLLGQLSRESNRDTIYLKKRREFDNYMINFEVENLSNIVGERFFMENAYGREPIEFQRILYGADEDFKNKHKEFIDMVYAFRQKAIESVTERDKLLNRPYIDFEFQTADGESRKLSDYAGKSEYLLIDFWASWCGPCIAEVPRLKKIYEKYKAKGLEIIGISLDDTKTGWRKGLEKTQTPWVQLCDFEGSNSELAKTYRINGIPCSFLLDKSGKIIKIGVGGEAWENWIEQIFE